MQKNSMGHTTSSKVGAQLRCSWRDSLWFRAHRIKLRYGNENLIKHLKEVRFVYSITGFDTTCFFVMAFAEITKAQNPRQNNPPNTLPATFLKEAPR
jgi:hypothetical protein